MYDVNICHNEYRLYRYTAKTRTALIMGKLSISSLVESERLRHRSKLRALRAWNINYMQF